MISVTDGDEEPECTITGVPELPAEGLAT